MSWERNKILSVIMVGVFLTSCSNIEYVSSREVPNTRAASFNSDYGKSKQFGALLFKSSPNADGSTSDGQAFIIRKNKSVYGAETLISDRSDDRKAHFKKTYFSFGADKKNKIVGLQLRFTY